MSNYAENNLNSGETIILKAKKSFLALIPNIVWCVLVLGGAIAGTVLLGGDSNMLAGVDNLGTAIIGALWGVWALIGILPLVLKILQLLSCCLCITNKRVIGKVGILAIKTLDYPIEKVDNVSIKAGMWGNLFHYHTVTVLGGGGSDAHIKFRGIGNATQFKNSVTAAVEQHAQEARRAQAEEIARAMSGNNN